MNRLYLFDFDGVIADSYPLYEQFIASCLKNIDPSLITKASDFLDFFDENFYEAIEKKGVSFDTFMEAAAAFGHLDYSEIEPFPDIVPVLKDLSKVHPLVIISSNQSPTIEEVLSRAGISDLFHSVFGADHMTSKTKKIYHAMKTMDKEPEQTFYIGDTSGDIREANRAGVRSVAVTWGWHDEERLRAAGPDYIVKTPAELIKLDGC